MKGLDYRRLSGWVIVLLLFLLIGVPPGEVHADIGLPPVNPSGSSIGLGEGERTNVRMVEEEVNLIIEPTTSEVPGGYFMRGRVEAVFLMRNLGATDEALDVWFPLATSQHFLDMFPLVPDVFVQDFQIWADGIPKHTEIVRVKTAGPDDPVRETHWASFPITFPSGKDVTVRVTYTMYPSGWRPFGGFEYILETGASWKDTIGKAVVKVHLPYPVTKENVSLSGKSLLSSPIAPQPPGYVIEGNVIRWELNDLEPGEQDNIFVDVLEPQRYQDLVKARSRAASEPDSADAQYELARAASGAVLVLKGVNQNGGGAELAEQVKVAYRRALELSADREDILVRYVNWLMMGEGYISLMRSGACPAEVCELLDRGLKLYPNNTDLINWDNDVRSMSAEATFQAQVEQKTSTAIAEMVWAKGQASTETALAKTTKPTITPTMPVETSTPATTPTVPATVITQATPQPTGVSAVSYPSPSQTPAGLRLQRGLIAFGLALVFIVVAVLIFRSGGLARRK